MGQDNNSPKPRSVGLRTQSDEEQSNPCWRKTTGLDDILLAYLLPNFFIRWNRLGTLLLNGIRCISRMYPSADSPQGTNNKNTVSYIKYSLCNWGHCFKKTCSNLVYFYRISTVSNQFWLLNPINRTVEYKSISQVISYRCHIQFGIFGRAEWIFHQ